MPNSLPTSAISKKLFYLALVLVWLALMATACGDSSQASSPGPDGTSTTTPEITETPEATRTVIFQDDFTNSASGWGNGSDIDRSVAYMQSMLEFKVFAAGDFVFSTPNDTDYTDVHMEVSIAPNDSNSDTAFGILCDQQTDNNSFYYAAITSLGKYTLAKAVARNLIIS